MRPRTTHSPTIPPSPSTSHWESHTSTRSIIEVTPEHFHIGARSTFRLIRVDNLLISRRPRSFGIKEPWSRTNGVQACRQFPPIYQRHNHIGQQRFGFLSLHVSAIRKASYPASDSFKCFANLNIRCSESKSKLTRSRLMRPISARYTSASQMVIWDRAGPFCTMLAGPARGF